MVFEPNLTFSLPVSAQLSEIETPFQAGVSKHTGLSVLLLFIIFRGAEHQLLLVEGTFQMNGAERQGFTYSTYFPLMAQRGPFVCSITENTGALVTHDPAFKAAVSHWEIKLVKF